MVNLTRIYTKTGDTGETSLFGGERVSKGQLRIESYGTVDELNSWIGLLRDQKVNQKRTQILIEIQDRLFTVGSRLATLDVTKVHALPELKEHDISLLEIEIDKMEQELPPMRNFILPGGHESVSFGHIARTVCRRAERHVVQLSNTEKVEPLILKYLNRLSDFLFVLCRKMSDELAATETPWKPRKS